MVRLLNDKNVGKLADCIYYAFKIQKYFTHIVNINEPNFPCIYAMWHAHQCCLYGISEHKKTNVMISRSKDGDIIASAIQREFGFKVVRGSKGRAGAVEATKQMIEALQNGDYGAIMVDGPRGPLHKVKNGIIKIAKHANIPIVPVTWYSNNFNFVKFSSWDKFELPILDVRLINLYGKPIYVPTDGDDESDEKCRVELENALLELDRIAPDEYKKVYRFGLWRRKHQ